ncbi:MAG: hypothetical protein ACLVL2_18940 [Bacteroides cellulosilyticus]
MLPVTMDDLTSGYNIAEILTLESDFVGMLGFAYPETETSSTLCAGSIRRKPEALR